MLLSIYFLFGFFYDHGLIAHQLPKTLVKPPQYEFCCEKP